MSGGCRVRSKARDLGSRPVGVRGFKSLPPHHAHLITQYNDFIKFINLKSISEDEKKRYKSVVKQFLKDIKYDLSDENIIIYINRLKSQLAPGTARKYVLRIRVFLKFIDHPLADQIELPKVPKKRRKLVVKSHHVASAIRDILNTNKSDDLKLKAVAAMLLSATSGMRAEEIYQLRFEDIDIDNRIIHIKAEIAKDYEDRITFFSEEAKEWLLKYLSMNPDPDKLFAKSSLKHVWTLISVKIGNIPFRLKHCRKFFSQQSDRLGMPTAIKKILMGHVVSDEEFVIPRGSDVDLSHYDFQDEEELRKIYDRYWRDFRILE